MSWSPWGRAAGAPRLQRRRGRFSRPLCVACVARSLRSLLRSCGLVRRAGHHGKARPSGLGLALFATLALFYCTSAGRAEAAPFDLKGEDWEGLSQFLHIAEVELGSSRTTATSTLDLHRLDPADAVVLVHPTRSLDVDELAAF